MLPGKYPTHISLLSLIIGEDFFRRNLPVEVNIPAEKEASLSKSFEQ